MNLSTIFTQAFKHAEELQSLYASLVTKNTRAARADWVNNVYKSNTVRWARRDGLWRSSGTNVLIIGNKNARVSQQSFQADNLVLLLRAALVFAMAAVDKILHDAITKKFVSLVKSGDLDDLIRFPISDSYNVAIQSRVRKGKGGKRKVRPSHLLKDVALDRLYRNSFLSNRQLQGICKSCGVQNVFQAFAKHAGLNGDEVNKRWGRVYQKRNHLAHECDIVRKEKAKKVHFNSVDPQSILDDIDFVKRFGEFLALKLN
jgi:hypothetical protein